MAITWTGSGRPCVSASQPPSPTRRKIPLRLPAVNWPAPTNTRDGLVMSWLLAVAKLRVPRVTQGITEEVEPEHGDADGQAGEDGQPGRLLHERSSGATQHEPPGGRRRLGSDAKEAEGRLDEDRVAEPDRRDDENRGRHVGQDVAE